MDSDLDFTTEEEFKTMHHEWASMSKIRILKNLIALCSVFLLLFSAFMALTNLQSTMNNEGNIGVISQSVIYAAMIISALFLPKSVAKKFGCKLSIVFSVLAYVPFIAANCYPSMWILLPTATALGIGASILWATSSTYINQLSFLRSRGDPKKAALYTSMYFGIFFFVFPTTQIWGNLVSFYVLRPTDTNNTNGTIMVRENLPFANSSCGSDFCGGIDKTVHPLEDEKRYILIGIFCGLSITAALVAIFFMDSLKVEQQRKYGREDGTFVNLFATFKQLVKVDQLLLVILTTFNGLEQGFIYGDYTEAYVACSLGMENVGLVFVCYGVISSTTSICVGRLLKYVPRIVMMTASALNNAALFVVLYTWNSANFRISYFLVAGFWAFSAAIWETLIHALYGVLFRSDEEAAFANYELFKALGYFIAFGCSSIFCITTKIYTLTGLLVIGMAGYFAVEVRASKAKR